MQTEHNSGAGAKGIHILTISKCTSDFALKVLGAIDANIKKWQSVIYSVGRYSQAEKDKMIFELHEEYRWLMGQLEHKHKTAELVVENVTTTVGRAALITRLVGTNTYTGNVTHCALGSSATAPAEGDTTLQTETYRKALTSGTPSSNVGILETFFAPGEGTGTLEEYGYFIDGSGAADSGQLFNRFTQTVIKAATESLNVQSTVTLSDV